VAGAGDFGPAHFMSRFIEFIVSLILLLIVRSVIAALVRAFKETAATATAPPTPQSQGELRSAGELRKDPVCETYISVPSPWAKLVKGETVYFCSKECKDRFKG
jgi:YHS domain-containing protein